MSEQEVQLLTVPEYAKRIGVAKYTIQNAIKEGMLKKSLVPGKRKNQKLINPLIADEEFVPRAPNIDSKRESLESEPEDNRLLAEALAEEKDDQEGIPPIQSSRRRREFFEARLAELKVHRESGKLVDAEEVEKEWLNHATVIRTKVLGIPSRFRQRVPEINELQYEILNDIVRMALEELADDNTAEDIE